MKLSIWRFLLPGVGYATSRSPPQMFKRTPTRIHAAMPTDTPSSTAMLRLIVVIALMAGAMHGALAFDGAVDPAFGSAGQVIIARPDNHGDRGDKPTGDLVVLGDGRFLWSAPLDDQTIWVGRHMRDGSPDPTFGNKTAGRITLPVCGQSFRPVRLLGDGAGGVIVWSDRCLRHLLDDGTLDSGFGSGGMPPSSFIAAALARDPSGRLLLAGRDGELGAVYRFDEHGSIDATFGTDGRVMVVAPNGTWSSVDALLIRPDGRMLIGGSGGLGNEKNLVVAQLQTDGSPDASWNGDGFAVVEAPANFHTLEADALALDTDGSLVVSGTGNNSFTSCCILLTRFDGAGLIVADFGLRLFGLSGSPSLGTFAEQRGGLVLLPNHRIIIGTRSFPLGSPLNHRTQFTLIRTFADGSLDPDFGHDGWNSYTIVPSAGASPAGDYNQMHAIGYDAADGSMLILGRTFFEDFSDDYVSMVRARLDLIFDGGFD